MSVDATTFDIPTQADGKRFVWSNTKLNDFETCPAKFYASFIGQTAKMQPFDKASWGNRVHEAVEKAVKNGRPLPENMVQYQRYVDFFRTKSVRVDTELKFGVKADWTAAGFFDADVYGRGAADQLIWYAEDAVGIFDLKTSAKFRPKTEQLDIYAAMVFANYPQVQFVAAMLVYPAVPKPEDPTFGASTEMKTYTRSNDFEALTEAIDLIMWDICEHNSRGVWPEEKNGLCKQYCDNLGCVFNGRNS